MPQYFVSLEKIIDTYKLEVLNMPCDPADILIKSPEVYRPGLQLAGNLYDFFERSRVQVMGTNEHTFLERSGGKREELIRAYFEKRPAVTILARGVKVMDCVIDAAKDYECVLLRTDQATSEFMAQLIGMLNVELAPRETMHGVLVEVYGEGILLTGESGVGKSETAMELVKRGHRLIADDAVEIRRVSARTLVGSSPQNIRHFMELRGIGIINVRQIFGIGSVKVTQQIDLIVNLEQWDDDKVYDRMGLENEYKEVLGNPVPHLTIPIKPGRNLAIIIEVAAMNNRQKAMGYNSAQDLLTKLGMLDPDEVIPEPNKLDSWNE
jgi:HPr kinase/phosphorylase